MSVNDTPPTGGRSRALRRSKAVRRITGALALMFALTTVALVYSAIVSNNNEAVASDVDAAQVAEGQSLYQNSCISCHGANLQGVGGRGPSLVGVGEAAAYFQVSSGRMPAAINGAQIQRKEPLFDAEQIDALAAYIQPNGGGPMIPKVICEHRTRFPAAGSCSGSTARPATTSPDRAAPSRRASTRPISIRRPIGRSGAPCSAARRTCRSSVTTS